MVDWCTRTEMMGDIDDKVISVDVLEPMTLSRSFEWRQ
jgi:hypothetical protein